MSIDVKIANIDKIICRNIDLIDFDGVTRDLVAQNLLSQSRNLVEHIALKIFSRGHDIEANWSTIPQALEFIKRDNKYQFLRSFHTFLQESKSHYTPDNEGAERLVLKYYQYYLQIREFMRRKFNLDVLHNIDKFPIDTDHSVQEYREKIAALINRHYEYRTFNHEPRMYVHKTVPFIVANRLYYEITLTPAYDTTSKFDRFVCYSSILVPDHYSIKSDIHYEKIDINGRKMPVNILTDFVVSVRPCELHNYASLFGEVIKISSSHSEYTGMMAYLSRSGASLLDIVNSSQHEYEWIKHQMFGRSQAHNFEPILDKSRNLISKNNPGSNVIRYLLHTLNNKIIKAQRHGRSNWKLSDLYLQWGCIPFDTMPFASSLMQHNPGDCELFGSISPEDREHEILARYIHTNMSSNSRLYTPVKELEEYTDNIDRKVSNFNALLYRGHTGRRIEKFGQSLYVKESYDHTKIIIEKLQDAAEEGVQGYSDAIDFWITFDADIDSEEKRNILSSMFAGSHVSLIYGAAGTGKTYILNHIAQFFDDHTKLFLANTNPAVDNLRRKVSAQNCEFMTIRKYLMTKYIDTEYDILVIDECSMVSNADMAALLEKVDYELLVLAGDTYQIESIAFGNWFSMARYFLPKYAWHELFKPYRTEDSKLLELWKKVRDLDNDLTEYIVNRGYASNLNDTVFDKKADDEIILCLNYDGFYGINNINRYLQENNKNKPFRWGVWIFKVGDPVLFNESERFAPALYNNLKGTIIDIELDQENDYIWFTIEVEKRLTALDVRRNDLELLEPISKGKSVIRFHVAKKKDADDDNDYADDTDIPFQIAYAVSIHKAQGLEYNSVKVVITRDIDEMITHNIFYTAITRSRRFLKIYWSPESQQKVLSGFEIMNAKRDAMIFAAQAQIKMKKV